MARFISSLLVCFIGAFCLAGCGDETESSRAAIDPALVGRWWLAQHDFAQEIPYNVRRYLSEQEERSESPFGQARREARRADQIDEVVTRVVDGFEDILDQAGFRLIRFRSDGTYTNGTDEEGMWLVSGDRLIMTTYNGRTYPSTYFVDETGLSLTITGDQIATLIRLERDRIGARDRRIIDNSFQYSDQVRLFYTND